MLGIEVDRSDSGHGGEFSARTCQPAQTTTLSRWRAQANWGDQHELSSTSARRCWCSNVYDLISSSHQPCLRRERVGSRHSSLDVRAGADPQSPTQKCTDECFTAFLGSEEANAQANSGAGTSPGMGFMRVVVSLILTHRLTEGYRTDTTGANSSFWNVEYYQKYFDVDTKTVSVCSWVCSRSKMVY